jgi:hypothetical protein
MLLLLLLLLMMPPLVLLVQEESRRIAPAHAKAMATATIPVPDRKKQ